MAFFRRRSQEPTNIPTLDPTLGDPAAVRLISDMERRDWRAVHNFLSTIEDPDQLQYYLNFCSRQNGVQAWIEDWIAAEPRSFVPFLVGGAHAIRWAWAGRGAARAQYTLRAQFKIFERRLRRAHALLAEAVARNPDDPTAWAELITCGKGMSLGVDEAMNRYREAAARHRWHYAAHENVLDQLLQKWGGSHQMAMQFAEQTAAIAPPSSGLANMVPLAHLEHWSVDLESPEDDEYLLSGDTIASLHAAADASVRHPDYCKRLGWQHDFNLFAMPLWQAKQWDAAGDMFAEIGDQITKRPWEMYNSHNPTGVFARARDEAAQNRVPRVHP